jgi:hypothetical protein
MSVELSFTLFPTSGRVYVWRTSKEAYNPECLVPREKHAGGSVKVWAAISCYSVGPFTTLHGRITASDYFEILGNQVRLMTQTLFLKNDAVSQDDNVPIHTARTVQSWFREHEGDLKRFPCSAQSPDLNITGPFKLSSFGYIPGVRLRLKTNISGPAICPIFRVQKRMTLNEI